MHLKRYESTSDGTFGVLKVNELTLHTVERPWLNNEPFKSCIPEGLYRLIPFTRSNGTEVYALIGDDVSLLQSPNAKRYAILIHAGNYVTDVVGCIAPGLTRHESMVTSSRMAMEMFMKEMKTATPSINIEWSTV